MVKTRCGERVIEMTAGPAGMAGNGMRVKVLQGNACN